MGIREILKIRPSTKLQLAETNRQLAETQKQLRAIRSDTSAMMIRGLQSGWYGSITRGTSRPSDLVSFSQLYSIYRKSSCVRACVDTIVREVSTRDWMIKPKEGREVSRDTLDFITERISNPNINKESFQQLLFRLAVDILVYDAGVIEKVRSISGKLLELWVRDGSTFRPIGDRHGVILKYLQVAMGAGSEVTFDGNDIVYFMLHPQSNSFYGLPIIESICDEVSSLLFANAFIANTFTDDEIPPGILVLGDLGQEAYDRAKAEFAVNRGRYHHRIKVMSGIKKDEMEWIRMDRPARDMQLVELVEKIDRSVYRAFGVSPVSMGQEGANRATAEVQYKVTDDRILGPLKETIAYYFNNEIIPEWSEDAEFAFRDGGIAESRDHAQSSSVYVKTGIMSINEVRHDMGREAIPGGDDHFILPGFEPVPVSSLGHAAALENLTLAKRRKHCKPPTTEEWKQIKKRHTKIIDVDALLKVKSEYEIEMMKFWKIAQKKVVRAITENIIIKRVSQDPYYLSAIRKKVDEELNRLSERYQKLAVKYFPTSLEVGVDSARKITGKSIMTEEHKKALLTEKYRENKDFIEGNLLKDVKRNSQFAMQEIFDTEEEYRTAVEAIFESESFRVERYAARCWDVGQTGFADEMFEQGHGECDWVTTSGRECPDCITYASGSPYRSLAELPAIPGDGTSVCDGYCYCVIEFK